jgi:hypothetical protein
MIILIILYKSVCTFRQQHDRIRGRATIIFAIRPAFIRLALLPLAIENGVRLIPLFDLQHSHGLLIILLPKLATVIDNEINPISPLREEVMLQWGRTKVGVDDMTGLHVDLCDPLGELEGIGDGGGEEDVMNFIREKNYCLFPYNTSLCSLLILRRLRGGLERHLCRACSVSHRRLPSRPLA